MSQHRKASGCSALLAPGLFADGLLVLPLLGQSTPRAATPASAATPAAASAPAAHEPSHFPEREQSYCELFFRVDSIATKADGILLPRTGGKARGPGKRNHRPIPH